MRSSIPRAEKSSSAGESIFSCARTRRSSGRRRRQHPLWRKYDAKYSRSNTGGGKWSNLRLPEQWQVHYKELTFNVKPMNFKHTGVFPEQAANWDFAMEKIRTAGRPISVLNLFAYTGGATIACAAAGRKRLPCGRGKGHGRLGKGKRAARPGWRIGPSAGSSTTAASLSSGKSAGAGATTRSSWTRRATAEVRPARCGSSKRTSIRLWSWQVRFFSDNPLFVIINSYTTGLAPSVLGYILDTLVSKQYGGKTHCDELGLPVTNTGLALPCGSDRPLDEGLNI